jgi:plasmid stability protein
MPTITVKNIPPNLYQRLKQSAEANRRSINSEVIVCIEKAVCSRKLQPEAFLARARELREKTADYRLTDDEFTQAKLAGRR